MNPQGGNPDQQISDEDSLYSWGVACKVPNMIRVLVCIWSVMAYLVILAIPRKAAKPNFRESILTESVAD